MLFTARYDVAARAPAAFMPVAWREYPCTDIEDACLELGRQVSARQAVRGFAMRSATKFCRYSRYAFPSACQCFHVMLPPFGYVQTHAQEKAMEEYENTAVSYMPAP